jgi:hypothetical protein
MSKSQDCHVLTEVSHVHTNQQEIIILTRHSPSPYENRHKENKGAMFSELPLHYIHGVNRDRRQIEETKAAYFPISWKRHAFTAWDCRPILTLVRYDMPVRSQCYYSLIPF